MSLKTLDMKQEYDLSVQSATMYVKKGGYFIHLRYYLQKKLSLECNSRNSSDYLWMRGKWMEQELEVKFTVYFFMLFDILKHLIYLIRMLERIWFQITINNQILKERKTIFWCSKDFSDFNKVCQAHGSSNYC